MIVLLILITGAAVAACSKAQKREVEALESPQIEQKEEVVTAKAASKNALKKGSMLPSFTLPDSKNELVSSEKLLANSNLALVFYRGGWCPFCNLYLKKLQDNLDEIKAAGGELVAISAENPDESLTTEQKNNLRFYVLSDKNLDYARKLGLVYQLPEETDTKYKSMGIDLVVANDMKKPELPISATYVVNREGKIMYSFVEPDYKKRAEPETVIAELKKIREAAPK